MITNEVLQEAYAEARRINNEKLIAVFDELISKRKQLGEFGKLGGRPKTLRLNGKNPKVSKEKYQKKYNNKIYNKYPVCDTADTHTFGRHKNLILEDSAISELTKQFSKPVVYACIDQLSDKVKEGYKSSDHNIALKRFCEVYKPTLNAGQKAVIPQQDYLKHNYSDDELNSRFADLSEFEGQTWEVQA